MKTRKQATQKLVFETNEKPLWFCYFRKLEDQVLSRKVVWFYGEKVDYQLKDKISLLGCNKIVCGLNFDSYKNRYKPQNVFVIETNKWKQNKKTFIQ